MGSNSDNLAQLPRFPSANAPGPQTPDEWVQFYRWLTELFSNSNSSTTVLTVLTGQIQALLATPRLAATYGGQSIAAQVAAAIASLIDLQNMLAATPRLPATFNPNLAPRVVELEGAVDMLEATPRLPATYSPNLMPRVEALEGAVSMLEATPRLPAVQLAAQYTPPVLWPGAPYTFYSGGPLTMGGTNGQIEINEYGQIVSYHAAT